MQNQVSNFTAPSHRICSFVPHCTEFFLYFISNFFQNVTGSGENVTGSGEKNASADQSASDGSGGSTATPSAGHGQQDSAAGGRVDQAAFVATRGRVDENCRYSDKWCFKIKYIRDLWSQTKLTFSLLAELKILTGTLWFCWCSFSQPEKKLLWRSFWHFKSACSISLSPFAWFTHFSHSEYKLTEALRLVGFCNHLIQPRASKLIFPETKSLHSNEIVIKINSECLFLLSFRVFRLM